MFTNTSAEYWRGDAALIHTDLVQMTEAPESDAVRRYHFAGTQHGIGVFPPIIVRPTDGIRGQLPFNTVDYTPLLRAVLTNLDRWVTLGASPPPCSIAPHGWYRSAIQDACCCLYQDTRSTVSTPDAARSPPGLWA